MTTTANRSNALVLSRHIDAPLETVRSLIADLHQQPVQLGSHRLHVHIPAGRERSLVYRLTTRRAMLVKSAEITLSPSHDNGTTLAWVIGRSQPIPWTRRGHASFAAAVAEFAARLASTAEDRPTTRAEWADRYELAA